MSSKAKQQKTNPKIGNVPPIQVSSFIELTAALNQAPELSGFQFEVPSEGVVSLQKDDITLIFIEDKAWQDSQSIGLFSTQGHDTGLCFICTGSDEDLESLPLSLEMANFRSLAFPCRVRQLIHDVQNFHRLQTLVLLAERTNQNVQETNEHVKYVLRVSRELNGVRDTKKLLSLILQKAREITNADAGSIYTVDWNDQRESDSKIIFKVTQNETVSQELEEFVIPVNERSMVGSAVMHQKAINIPDLYLLDEDSTKNPYYAKHDKTFDLRTGYQCRSMLTIPMYDISYRVIGVIQLINRKRPNTKNLKGIKDFTEYVITFDESDVEYAEIVAQQAGIALENAMLTHEKEMLFEGFVNASVTAIEQRDPTTSGHSHRVAKLTVGLAEIINKITTGPFKDTMFDKKQLKEIEYASLLHDFGKLGVREQVLTKAKKLYPWELDLLLERFEHIRSRFEVEYLRDYIAFLSGKITIAPGFGPETFQSTYENRVSELEDFLQFILKSNEPTVLEQGGFERLKDIANMSFRDGRQKTRPLLNYRELEALSVSRGSLTREEFAEIQSHVKHTYEFLRKIPWGRSFPNVPQIAAKHHEKLDGTGYPGGSHDDEIPAQTRMMTIADIFDALTAADRPYKKAVPVPRALDIIEMEVKAGKVDSELFKVFVESQVYQVVIDKNQQAS
jgi:HD-GYP domain-containing protein (c-di-GMP phosphodiesterase class II)